MPPSPPFGCPNLQRTTAEVASRHTSGEPHGIHGMGMGWEPSPHTCEPHDMHGLSQGCQRAQQLPRPTGQHGLENTSSPSRLVHGAPHSTIVCVDSLHMGLHVSRSGGPELLVVIKVGPVGVSLSPRTGPGIFVLSRCSCHRAAVGGEGSTSSSSWLHARREYISGWLPWPAGGPEGARVLDQALIVELPSASPPLCRP